MRRIPLSRGLVALVDDVDYDAVMAAGPWRADSISHTYYAKRNVRRSDGTATTQYLHRFLVDGPRIDHANGDGLDNRRSNLRPATKSQNNANSRLRARSTSGFKGAYWDKRKGRWRSEIKSNGRCHFLGYFGSAVEAAHAYDAAALRHFGEFARLNFPTIAAALEGELS